MPLFRSRSLRSTLPALVLGGCGLVALSPSAGAEEIQSQTAVLGWLDKVTARVGEARVSVGEDWRIGSLAIVVRSCVRRVPPDDPESGAFLDITELRDNAPPSEVFRGWMFASSPALSAMDHGVYDVWIKRCEIPADLEAGDVQAPDPGEVRPVEPTDPSAVPLD